MAKVIIAFSRDHSVVGKTVEIDDDEAAVLVSEGRARYADETKADARKAPKQNTGSTR
jgi:hypothetical protein